MTSNENTESSGGQINPFAQENLIGTIVESGPSVAKIILREEVTESGEVLEQTNVGEYVILKCGTNGVLGKVSDLKMDTSGEFASLSEDANDKNQLIAVVKLVISINFQTGEIFDGVAHRPKIQEGAYRAHSKIIQIVLEHQLETGAGQNDVTISYAKLWNAEATPVTLTPEKMFGRHCGIVGMSGSGKSWSVARLMEECAKHKSKIILLDATGEFYTMERGVKHVHLGEDLKQRGSKEVSLPYYHLTEQDLFVIFSPSGDYQAPKLKEAMKSLKIARLEPGLAPDGTIVKAHRDKLEFEKACAKHFEEVDSSYCTFLLDNLTRQIRNECVDPQRSAQEPGVWGGPNSPALSYCTALMGRIDEMRKSGPMAPLFQPEGKPSLLNEINAFLKDKENSILRINLQYLSFANSIREIVVNSLGRYLLGLARKDVFRKAPILITLDEAHQFLNKTYIQEGSQYSLDSFALIAKEGRKYSITMCLATQRPRDIPEGVLSQMGTLVIHRLTNDLDRHIIERASGDIDTASINAIPTLTPGQAIIMGVDFPMPLEVRVEPPVYKPFSSGADYQKFWS